ncbi:MAG TPA: IS481 family transposase, partial [Opitutales bacterium]|nr:IS481 family transposase [Opitutales bacterium]
MLSAPPESGALQEALNNLSKKQWRHPITGEPVYFGLSTIERWLYHSRHKQDPVKALRSKQREDAGKSRQLSAHIKQLIQQQHRQHPSWSCQLHVDNIGTLVRQSSEQGVMPSYNTVRRYMKSNGFYKQSRIRKRNTLGAAIAAERLETREVRSFEMDHVHALWHL